jgi:hypothetical protein
MLYLYWYIIPSSLLIQLKMLLNWLPNVAAGATATKQSQRGNRMTRRLVHFNFCQLPRYRHYVFP